MKCTNIYFNEDTSQFIDILSLETRTSSTPPSATLVSFRSRFWRWPHSRFLWTRGLSNKSHLQIFVQFQNKLLLVTLKYNLNRKENINILFHVIRFIFQQNMNLQTLEI